MKFYIGLLDDIYRKYKILSRLFFTETRLRTSLSTTKNGEVSYQYGPGNYRYLKINEDICIIFIVKKSLSIKPIWSVYGTFTVVLLSYYRLYTFSFLEGSHGVPCVFDFL